MASGSTGDFTDDVDSRGRVTKVYTRKIRKKAQQTNHCNGSAAATDSVVLATSSSALEVSTTISAYSKKTSPCPWRASPVTTATQLNNEVRDGVQEPVVPAENVILSEHEVREDSICLLAESGYLEKLPLLDNNSVGKFTSPCDSPNEQLRTNGHRIVHSKMVSLRSCENDLQDGRSIEVMHRSHGNDQKDDEDLVPGPPQIPTGRGTTDTNAVANPILVLDVEDKVRFSISHATPKNEIEKLRKRLESELDQVRRLVKQLEAKESQLSSNKLQISDSNLRNISNYVGNLGVYTNTQPELPQKDVNRKVVLRVNPEMGVMQNLHTRPIALSRVSSDLGTVRSLEPKPYSRQLSVAVMESSIEKEKRTPKANQYYRQSEFLLAKDRLPPESNKKQKTDKVRKHRGETGYGFGFGFGFDKSRNRAFKNCSSILQRLMKHNYGWVFNEAVNAKALGLHDYHNIITHPMDFGTIKTRLAQKWYKSVREFAEDVRLVFRNAMTYNPKGQDVHFMAEQLSQIFEERWAILETEYNHYWKYQMYLDAGLPTPGHRRALSQSHYPPAMFPGPAPTYTDSIIPANFPPTFTAPPFCASHLKNLDRSEVVSGTMAVDPVIRRPHNGRIAAPKKPKAKDPDKRDMTSDERQRLGKNLQNLPSEKLDAIVQIIKRRNTALSQNDDEIEVDIDQVDTETLWELDRFVTNYKKSLSKIKRRKELALQARMAANQNLAVSNTVPTTEVQNGNSTAFDKSDAPLAAEGGKQEHSSSSSSSSSSDSGSSSSDSDSDSSSSEGSDEGNSPKS